MKEDIVFRSDASSGHPPDQLNRVPRKPAPSRRCAFEVVGQLVPGAVVPFIYEEVLQQILRYSEAEDRDERGGFLLGGTFQDEGQYVEVTGFIPAEQTTGSAAHLRFTHETWARLWRSVETLNDGAAVVGWQHTHPNLGVFLSEYDRFIHRHFFAAAWQVAMVVDPRRAEFAFFQWQHEEIVDCGFVLVRDRLPANESARESGV